MVGVLWKILNQRLYEIVLFRNGETCGMLFVIKFFGAWRSLVARLPWAQEVPGSNPGAPTNFPELSFSAADCGKNHLSC